MQIFRKVKERLRKVRFQTHMYMPPLTAMTWPVI